uniref:Leucine-rich repeat-containing N-terminal plant-type domain-containing protein n=1 Tax=Aegilops tauschii subsp. strangulata TaxID=200361 RepID=A0A453SQF1_AEGTS
PPSSLLRSLPRFSHSPPRAPLASIIPPTAPMASSVSDPPLLPVVVVLLLLSAAPFLAFSSEPLNAEVMALVAIKQGLVDAHGVLSNWDEDSVDPCSWAMITCSPHNLVIGLGERPARACRGPCPGGSPTSLILSKCCCRTTTSRGGCRRSWARCRGCRRWTSPTTASPAARPARWAASPSSGT